MVTGIVAGVVRAALIVLSGVGGFVAFGRITAHLVGAVEVQMGVAVAMGLITGVAVHRVVATSEIARVLSDTPGEEAQA